MDYHCMSNYGESIGPSLTFTRKGVMIVKFLWITFQILLWSYYLFLEYLIISDHLTIAVSATTVVYGIKFNSSIVQKCPMEKKTCNFLHSQNRCKTVVSQNGGLINLLFLCKPKEYFRLLSV